MPASASESKQIVKRQRAEAAAAAATAAELSSSLCLLLLRSMRQLASRASYIWRGRPGTSQPRNFSFQTAKDERSVEEEAERKIGWLLKLFFAGTASVFAYQFFPYMGDNLIQQSVSLLRVKDPLFKRMGASRLTRFAIDDERRLKVVNMGGAQELVNMLAAAKDDRTRKAALKAIVALSVSDEAAGALHQAGATSVVNSALDSSGDEEVMKYKSSLRKRFNDLRFDIPT